MPLQVYSALGIRQPTVSKHLRVLREAGFVESTVDAQRRLYRLKPEPLREVEAWLAPFRQLWSAHVDRVRPMWCRRMGPVIYWLVVAAISAFIVYGRLVLKPIR